MCDEKAELKKKAVAKKKIELDVSWVDAFLENFDSFLKELEPIVYELNFLDHLRMEFKAGCGGENGVWGCDLLMDSCTQEELEDYQIMYAHLKPGAQVATMSRIFIGAVAKYLKIDNSRNFKPGSKSFIYPSGMYTVTK